MKTTFNRIIIFLIVLGSLISCISPIASASLAEKDTYKDYFKGKTISILGDSISTFYNKTNGSAAKTTNSTIKNYPSHYKPGVGDVYYNDTWWNQVANVLGAKILVNNSYSKSKIFNKDPVLESDAYLTRAVNLHDNTGENAGEKPDIIAIYLGVNDVASSKNYFGSVSEIQFNKIIKKNGNTVTYAKPQTTFEAYAIMLHKIKTKYPNAEIYCFNVLPRYTTSTNHKNAITHFNKNVKEICSYFKCNLVDLYNDSGITDSEKNYNRYIHDDKVHPSKKGMSAIANAFLKSIYKNSKYIPKGTKKYSISYNLQNTIVNEGTLKTILHGDDFNCSLSRLVYGRYDVTVTMNSTDITKSCYNNGKINIPNVKGNIKITAKSVNFSRAFYNYRFEVKNQKLISVKTNENKYNSHTLHKNGYYSLNDKIRLYYDKSWSIVFGLNSNISQNIEILNAGNERNLTLYFDKTNNILGIKNKSTNVIFGINLKSAGINTNAVHTYKIRNKYDSLHGKNTFYVYVDGHSIGRFNKYFNSNGNVTSNKFNMQETNLVFSQIGTTSNPFDINTLKYIQIWESNELEKHVHDYDYPIETKATCTTPRTIVTVCDCGKIRKEYYGKKISHTKSKWITTKKATQNTKGKAVIKCTVCDKILDTKTINQLKCTAPKLSSVKNTISGIKLTWKKTFGADSYRIYRKPKGGSWEFIAKCSTTYYVDTQVNNKNGKIYYYTVKAVNEAGYSKHQSGLSVKRLITPTHKTVQNTPTGIKFTYSAVTGADYYRIYRKTPNGKWEIIAKTSKTNYLDTEVKSSYGKKFIYTVRAVDEKTFSSYRNGTTITRQK